MAESDGATTPAEAEVETPEPRIWRFGRVAVASGLAVSIAAHFGLLGTALFVSPLLGRPAPVYAVPVELVTPDQVPQSPTFGQGSQSSQSDQQTQQQSQ